MEWKSVTLKDAEFDDEKGFVRAVFATLNVIDLDEDMILPGAFGQQRVRMSAFGHSSWDGVLPVGKGRIFEEGEQAIFEGSFFTETSNGKETYLTVKAMGDLQEWSFALPEIDYEIREIDNRRIRVLKRIVVPEVSPVLLGAGVGTRTLGIKSLKTMKLVDQVGYVHDRVDELTERLKTVQGLREADGRTISEATIKKVNELIGSLKASFRVLEGLMVNEDDLLTEYARFQKILNDRRQS